jgi:AraC-like DNA-binding protein
MPLNIDYHSSQGSVSDKSRYLTHRPTAPLNRWLHEFWQLIVPLGSFHYRSIPDNCVDFIINLMDPTEAFIVTPFSSAKVFDMVGPVTYFGIRFRPLGYQGLISDPIGAWNNTEHIIDARDLLSEQILLTLCQTTYTSMSFQARCDSFSTLLLGLLQDYKVDLRLARYLIYCDQHTNFSIDLSNKQCAEFGISARQLRRITSQYLGMSPNAYAKTLRFQQTLREMKNKSLAAVAASYYYDQPHFIRDFKSFSGLTPNEFSRMSVLYNTN